MASSQRGGEPTALGLNLGALLSKYRRLHRKGLARRGAWQKRLNYRNYVQWLAAPRCGESGGNTRLPVLHHRLRLDR